MMPVSARYDIDGIKSASALKVGDSIVIECALREELLGRYILNDGLTTGSIIGDESVFIVEQGPADIRTGAATIYLRRVSDDKYLSGNSGSLQYSSEISDATSFQVVSCGEDIPWSTGGAWENYVYGVNKDGTTDGWIPNWALPNNNAGPKVATDASVGLAISTGEKITDYTWLGYYGGPGYMGYADCNQWNLYAVHFVSDYAGDLESLINQYADEGEYTAGTDPGFYQEDVANAYQSALENAMLVQASGQSDEEFIAAIDQLKAAHAALPDAVVPITEGYYYVVSGFDDYLNNFGIEKAVYPNTNAQIVGFKTLDTNNPEFVWHLTPGDTSEEWWMQSYLNDYYVGNPPGWYGCNAPISYDRDEPQNFRLRFTGKFFWGSRSNHGTSYCTDTGVNASDNEGNITSWAEWSSPGTVEHHFNLWYLRKITDQSLLDSFAEQKAKAALNTTLNSLVKEANELYSNLFAYRLDTENPLITVAGGGPEVEIVEGNQITFSNVRKQGVAYSDDYKFLIDNVDTTYMQGSGSIYFDISKDPQQTITFSYKTRASSFNHPSAGEWGANERPNRVQVYVTNDTADASSWKQVTTAEMGELSLPAQLTFDCGAQYSFVRIDVLTNRGGGNYFTVSDVQLYKTVPDQSASQYYTTTGMKEAADAMFTLAEAKRAIVAADSATQADVDEMQAAINAVRTLYADTTELASLIAECETLLSGVEVGDEIGQVNSQELIDNLRAAIDSARVNAFGSPINVAAIQAATALLNTARTAFVAGMKTVEPDKWYFITNADTERTGDVGADDARCTGAAIYLDNKYAGASVTKWGLVDQSSGALNADNNPKAMWRFIVVDSTNNYYAIQNMYSGYYMGNFAGAGINLPVSETPVPYNLSYKGEGKFEFIPATSQNRNGYSLWPEGAANDVVCHESGTAASYWNLIEIDPEEQQAISIHDFGMNTMDVMSVPYNFSDLALNNDDQVHTYAIKKITQTPNEAGELVSTIEFYEKNEFAAGEPCLIVLGDTAEAATVEGFDLVLPFPTEMVDHSHQFVSNGIVGGLHGFTAAAGNAISTGKKFTVIGGDGAGFDAQTGFIDPSTYTGEVEGVETAYTITVVGMNAIPSGSKADVNGDGVVNSSDVSAVYSFISDGADSGYTQDAADVDGNGTVDSSDVAAIYAQISGTSASSKAFVAKILKMLK